MKASEQVQALPEKAALHDPAAADTQRENPELTVEPPPQDTPAVSADWPQTLLLQSPASVIQAAAVPPGRADAAKNWSPDVLEEAVVHRVMQRIDTGLDQRLRDAIANVVVEQTRSLLPRLREEVESVVRQAVCEAVADEVAVDAIRKLQKS